MITKDLRPGPGAPKPLKCLRGNDLRLFKRLFFPLDTNAQGANHAPCVWSQSLRNTHLITLTTLIRDQVLGCVFLTLQHSQLCSFECYNSVVAKRANAMPIVAVRAKAHNITILIVVAKLMPILRLVDSIQFCPAIKGTIYHLILRRE